MITWQQLRTEPFRLFFPLGALFGCIGVGHWLGYASGWSTTYSGFFHASMQVGLYMPCFIVGFLLTALPRFSSTPPASTPEFLLACGLFAVQLGGLLAGRWIVAETAFAGLLLFLLVFAGRRFLRRRAAPFAVVPPTEFVWIPIAVLLGLAGTVCLIGGQSGAWPAWTLALGRPMAQQGFVLGIVLGVAGFLAPRLMGRDVVLAAPTGMTPARTRQVRRRRVALHLLAGAALLVSFGIEATGRIGAAYLLRAVLVTAELVWTTRFVTPPKITDGYVKLLWASLWLVVLGVWSAGLLPRYRVAALHLVFLGGFSLMAFAVATMVVLSHTGEPQRLRQPLWVLRLVGWGIAGAITARLIAERQPETFFRWLGVASLCWLIAGVGWILFALPRVLRPLDPHAFERTHAAAKQRLLNTPPTSC